MADPATQFQPASIQATGFQPTEYRPTPINVPTGAGELWAQVGRTALSAAQQVGTMLQQSPLNPVVKEGMNESIARSKLGEAAMQHAMANPNWAYGATAESPQGASLVAPITQPVAQQAGQNIDYSGQTQQPKKTEEQKTPEQPKKPTPEPPKNLNSGMTQVTPGTEGLSASTDNDFLLQRMMQERQAVGLGGSDAAQQGTPASMTFTNPATGNVEPLQTPSVFASRGGAQAPAAPTGSPPQAQTPAAATQTDQAAMAKWQAQNAHPVMTSQEALGWMKNQTTLAQDATYLPMGGPNGSPAYAFHMKGGGMNIVPISQMIQKGAGPLVAAQNTSAVISQTDQAQGGAAPMPSGTGAGAPQGTPAPSMPPGPPPAPGLAAMPSGTGAGAPQPVSAGPPPAPGDYNAAAYQMPQGPTLTQNGQVNPALMAGADNQQAAQAARDAQKANASSEQLEADANSAHPIYNWQPDEKGHVYTSLPDPEGRPFVSQRYYKGTLSGFQSGTWNTDNRQKEEIYDEMVGTKGVPIPKDADGNPIQFDANTIADFTPDQQRIWLKYVRDYNLHPNAPLATSPEGVGLSNAAKAVQDAQRIKDKILYLQKNNVPMDTVSQAELIRSQEAHWASGAGGNPWEWILWNGLAHGAPGNNFADELRGDYEKLNTHLAGTPGGTYPNAATPPRAEWGGKIPGTDIDISLPRTSNVSTVSPLNSIGGGDTYDQALAHIQEVLDNAKGDYKNVVNKLGPANYRIPDTDAKNLSDLADPKKGYIDDPTNKIWDKDHQQMVNGYGKIPYRPNQWFTGTEMLPKEQAAQPSPTPSRSAQSAPTPVTQEVAAAAPRPKTQADYDAIKSGTLFYDGDGKLKPKP